MKRYSIDLDAPPAARWSALLDDYAPRIKEAEHLVDDMLSRLGILASTAAMLGAGSALKLGLVYAGDEICHIARRCGIPAWKLLMLHLAYEASSCCTSILCRTHDGAPMHARTMDWGLSELKALTVELDFRKNGRPLFLATSWAGYVGVLTGMRAEFSLAVNFRATGDGLLENVKQLVYGAWPVGFLVRHTLENAETFEQAVGWLSASQLVAPTYFTICGKEEAALITRNRQGAEELCRELPIVQTNIDRGTSDPSRDILRSIERRKLGLELLGAARRIDAERLWSILERGPISNSITVYGAVMCPRTGFYETRLN